MYRGSSETVIISVEGMPDDVEHVSVIMSQRGIRLVKEDDDLVIDTKEITFDLTPDETMLFDPGDLNFQVKVETPEGEVFWAELMRENVLDTEENYNEQS